MNTREQKQKLREQLLARRSNLSKEAYLKKSARIISRLQDLPEFGQSKVVHCYVSMNQRREVNTHTLIKTMLDAGKKVVVPVTQVKSGTLRHVRLQSFGDLEKNDWGVLEPAGGEEVAVASLDLVIVPMAGGDRQKNRIGYGKGFYDRFLQKVNGPSVGLLFEQCLVDEVPTESFDVPLDMIVTEKELIDG